MYEYEKYVTTPENLKETIDKYGVAIIPNLLNDDECEEMQNEMWNYLEHITQEWTTPIDRNNQETWSQMFNLTHDSLLFEFWNIGHSQMVWNVRQNPKIVDVFAKFYNVKQDELVSSFDAASIYLPPEIVHSHWHEDIGYWYHTDESFLTKSFSHIQSWVTAYDVNENDGTLAFYESSNKYHEEFKQLYNITDPTSFYKLNENELEFFDDFCVKKKIKCPKGSLVLWSSKTIHCGIYPSENRLVPNTRCVSYLCYAPRSEITEENLLVKQEALYNLKTTGHDPLQIRFKPFSPINDEKISEKYITKILPPLLTELGFKLAGF